MLTVNNVHLQIKYDRWLTSSLSSNVLHSSNVVLRLLDVQLQQVVFFVVMAVEHGVLVVIVIRTVSGFCLLSCC